MSRVQAEYGGAIGRRKTSGNSTEAILTRDLEFGKGGLPDGGERYARHHGGTEDTEGSLAGRGSSHAAGGQASRQEFWGCPPHTPKNIWQRAAMKSARAECGEAREGLESSVSSVLPW
jgi:hypothetical protein